MTQKSEIEIEIEPEPRNQQPPELSSPPQEQRSLQLETIPPSLQPEASPHSDQQSMHQLMADLKLKDAALLDLSKRLAQLEHQQTAKDGLGARFEKPIPQAEPHQMVSPFYQQIVGMVRQHLLGFQPAQVPCYASQAVPRQHPGIDDPLHRQRSNLGHALGPCSGYERDMYQPPDLDVAFFELLNALEAKSENDILCEHMLTQVKAMFDFYHSHPNNNGSQTDAYDAYTELSESSTCTSSTSRIGRLKDGGTQTKQARLHERDFLSNEQIKQQDLEKQNKKILQELKDLKRQKHILK